MYRDGWLLCFVVRSSVVSVLLAQTACRRLGLSEAAKPVMRFLSFAHKLQMSVVVLSGLMFRVLSIAIETETVSPERERESCTGTR